MATGLCSSPLSSTPFWANRYVPCSVASEHFALEAFSSLAYPAPIARTPTSPTTSSTTPAAHSPLGFMLVLLSSAPPAGGSPSPPLGRERPAMIGVGLLLLLSLMGGLISPALS